MLKTKFPELNFAVLIFRHSHWLSHNLQPMRMLKTIMDSSLTLWWTLFLQYRVLDILCGFLEREKGKLIFQIGLSITIKCASDNVISKSGQSGQF